jgi:hypothetical protein
MIGLGLRLASLGGRWSLVPMALTALAVAFGTSILLFALSFQSALQERYDRGAWRETPGVREPGGQVPGMTLLSLTIDHLDGRELARIDVASVDGPSPVPPGLPRLPEPGEAFVSPALAERIDALPSDQLADRFGTVVGTIDEAGLRGPNELVAVVGLPVAELQAAGSRGVDGFASQGEPPTLDWIVALIVVIAVVGAIAPVAVFVASATRLSAARRDRRLVALRLSGATPGQVGALAAVDALLITVPGALLGIVLFLLTRPAIALFPLGDLTWFPSAIVPPFLPAALVIVAVPVVGVAAAVLALRRMQISPLGVARRVSSGPPTRWRGLPVAAALITFVVCLGLGATPIARDSELVAQAVLIGVGLSFFGVVAGIVILGPLLTSYVGRVLAARGGPVRLLAGRRLIAEPKASFSGVAGVVMAVFVASAFFGIVAYSTRVSVAIRVAIPPHTLYADVTPGSDRSLDAMLDGVLSTQGVLGAAVVREGILVDSAVAHPEDPSDGLRAWIVPCADLLATADVPAATCGDADIHVVSDVELPADGRLLGYPAGADAQDLEGSPTVDVGLRPGLTVDRLLPLDAGDDTRTLPAVVIEPSSVEDDAQAIRPRFVLVSTDGTTATIERVRTQLVEAMPTSGPATGAEVRASATGIVDEIGRIVTLGVVMTMAVAGASLAIAVTGGLLDRRRPFALLRLTGVPLRDLRSVLLLEAAAPLAAVAVVGAVLGVLVSQLLLRLVAPGADIPLPDPSLAVLLVASVAGALLVVAGMLPMVGPLTDLEETRFE